MSTVDERVAAGIAELDQLDPIWFRRIDVDRLDMNSSEYDPKRPGDCGCVLAQLDYRRPGPPRDYGDYYHALSNWFGREAISLNWEFAHGFLADHGDVDEQDLAEAWRQAIATRLQGATA
jgi:hypothetical protein